MIQSRQRSGDGTGDDRVPDPLPRAKYNSGAPPPAPRPNSWPPHVPPHGLPLTRPVRRRGAGGETTTRNIRASGPEPAPHNAKPQAAKANPIPIQNRKSKIQNRKGAPMHDTKPWYASLTVWGAVVSLLASLLALFKVRLDPQLQSDLRDWLLAAATLAGGAASLWGRLRASRR